MQENSEFEENLNTKMGILKECQVAQNLDSCFKCEKMLECQTRKNYVDSVYNSMSRGEVGSFNFETE